jgi:predicted metal-dependent peptidase
MDTPGLEQRISTALLRIRMRHPFFGTLALFTTFASSESVAGIATDGRRVFVNPAYTHDLNRETFAGLLLHGFLHPTRRGGRDMVRWNMAADIVVNGIVRRLDDVALPPESLIREDLEDKSVEEVYALLEEENPSDAPSFQPDLLEPGGEGGGTTEQQAAQLEAHWRNALRQAEAVARSAALGMPGGLEREFEGVTQPRVSWRDYLWRFMVRSPTDYSGFDRRFIGHELYLDALEGEALRVFLCVDTSASITQGDLRALMSEVLGILSAYPQLELLFFYADERLYGPHQVETWQDVPPPVGGGGTLFVPFFAFVEEHAGVFEEGVCVYVTDGYGTFPQEPSRLPTLWVVPPGGRERREFPFGEVVRLL